MIFIVVLNFNSEYDINQSHPFGHYIIKKY
jgi:hypothetical protein